MLLITLSTSYRLLSISLELHAKVITVPTNNDPQPCSSPINIRFHRTLNTSHTHEQTRLCTSLLIAHSSLHLCIYMLYLLTHILTLNVDSFFFLHVSPPVLLTEVPLKADMWSLEAHYTYVYPNVCQFWILISIIVNRNKDIIEKK